MASSDIFTLGLGLTPPWRVIDQRLETDCRATIKVRVPGNQGERGFRRLC